METKNTSIDRRLVAGLLLIAVGGLLLLDKAGLLPFDMAYYIFSWKTLLIGIGVITLTNHENRVTGYILIGLGLLFWLPDLMDHSIRLSAVFWPAVLIGIGILIIARKNEKKYQLPKDIKFDEGLDSTAKGEPSNRTADYIDELAIFGGGNVRVASENFRGGRITAIFGGSDIDLKHAKPADTCVIDLFIMFGGSKLILPEDWEVKSEVVSIFGGSSDKRVFPAVRNIDKLLVVKGIVLFGGVEIKSY